MAETRAGDTPVYLMSSEEWNALSWEEKDALHEECGGAQPYHSNYLACRLSHAIFSGVEIPLERLDRMSDLDKHYRAIAIIERVYNEYGANWVVVHSSVCDWALRTVTPDTVHSFFRKNALKHPAALGALYNEGLLQWSRCWAERYTGPPDDQSEEDFMKEFGVPVS